MAELRCPITGSTEVAPLCTQRGFEWVRFPASGLVRLREMPGAVGEAEPLGPAYIAKYEAKSGPKRRRSLARARWLRRHARGDTLLDVGSNVGIFVDAAGAAGFRPTGIEPEPALVAHARVRYPDFQFHHTLLEDFATTERFAAIYCSEVIEHAPDPARFAAALLALLQPGGVLFLTTPDIAEYTHGGQVVRDLGAPDHKLYFTRENIEPFLRSVGFSAVAHKFSLRRKGIRVLATR